MSKIMTNNTNATLHNATMMMMMMKISQCVKYLHSKQNSKTQIKKMLTVICVLKEEFFFYKNIFSKNCF